MENEYLCIVYVNVFVAYLRTFLNGQTNCLWQLYYVQFMENTITRSTQSYTRDTRFAWFPFRFPFVVYDVDICLTVSKFTVYNL